MANWICTECGQDSKDSSEFCEICCAPRATAETTSEKVAHPRHETFEVDGQQIRYEAEKPLIADSSISNAWVDIARTNKEQGLKGTRK